MKNGICPMCGSTQVYTNPTVSYFASNTRLNLRDDHGHVELGSGFVPYVCLDCGYAALFAKEIGEARSLSGKPGWEKAA